MMSRTMKKIRELLVEGQALPRPESNFSMAAGGWTCQRDHEQTIGRREECQLWCFLFSPSNGRHSSRAGQLGVWEKWGTQKYPQKRLGSAARLAFNG